MHSLFLHVNLVISRVVYTVIPLNKWQIFAKWRYIVSERTRMTSEPMTAHLTDTKPSVGAGKQYCSRAQISR